MVLYGSTIYQGRHSIWAPVNLSDDNYYIEILTTKFEAN